MNIFTVIVVLVISWWLILFMLLPIGVQIETSTNPHHSTGAPKHPYIGRKLIGATVFSILLTVLFFTAMEKGWFDFLDIGY